MSEQNETVDAPENTNLNVQVIKGDDTNPYDSLISNSEHKTKRDESKKGELSGGYTVSINSGNAGAVIVPKYDPILLAAFAEESSSLNPCIAAMEINIDGTGYDIMPVNEKEWLDSEGNDSTHREDPIYQSIVDFFENPHPNETLTGMRRKVRRDLEQCGNGALEVLLAKDGTPLFMKYLDAKYLRLMEYGDQDNETVQREVMRAGKKTKASLKMKRRRYMYRKGKTTRYLKELGSERELNAVTGMWVERGKKVVNNQRASAVIHFKLDKDANDEYGLPRWISKVRSMKGELEAESLNLNYFENGGIPPVIIFLQNGKVESGSLRSLNAALSGKAEGKSKGVVVETESTTGSLDKEGKVDVKVERFSSEQTKDSLFGGYLDKCSKEIKGAYRLPQLFLGKSEDYNFATAYASILVAEAQVFKPERDEFDEIIDLRLMTHFSDKFTFRSRSLSVVDTETKTAMLLNLSNNKAITNEEYVRLANTITDMDIQYSGVENTNPLGGILDNLAPADLTPNSDSPSQSEENNEIDETTKRENLFTPQKVDDVASTLARMIKNEEVSEDELKELRSDLAGMTEIQHNIVSIKLAREIDPDSTTLDALGKLNAAANALLLNKAL
ncbi:capsid portal protein [Vibrio phage vB_VpaS_VP-RY-9]|nr:capsid portal protein [Vibrio phage vB_VpaS_VP-RY-9]